jgi:hypothetical protein
VEKEASVQGGRGATDRAAKNTNHAENIVLTHLHLILNFNLKLGAACRE